VNNFIVPGRGSDPGGLVGYLFGPGRANEHTDQRVIAAAETLGIEDGRRLDFREDREEIRELGRALDTHRKAMGVEITDGHVWHCSISLRPDESLSDEQWAEAARLAVKELGFDESSGKAPCRWVAVHHGRSVGGNEHIHLAVNLVREDGTKASTFNDRRKMSRVCGELEKRFGLRAVEGRSGGGMPGLSRAEMERAARTPGKEETDRERLARTVRGCATASSSEAEFVRWLRDSGVLVRPRYEQGGRSEVVGYSVALRPGSGAKAGQDAKASAGAGRAGDKTVWFGGGKLARDLTLPRLREHWPEGGSARAMDAALSEWSRRGGRAVTPRHGGSQRSGQSAGYGPEVWRAAAQEVGRVREKLAGVRPGDYAAWAGVAREAAGVMAAWSTRLEGDKPGSLAAAADGLARSAQTTWDRPRAQRVAFIGGMRGVAMVAGSAPSSSKKGGRRNQSILLQQMRMVIEAIAMAHHARRNAEQAVRLAEISRRELLKLQRAWVASSAADPTGPPVGPAAAKPSPAAGPSSAPSSGIPPVPQQPPLRPRPPHGPEMGRG
jgi:hypothetical protein